MSYEGWRPLLPYISCDECYKRLYKDDEDRVFNTVEDAGFAAEALGWHRYEQPDGDPRHVCPQCVEEEDGHDS